MVEAKADKREAGVTLAGLKAFVAVAEARSFSVGAKTLGLSQSTVSFQVAALEQACGLLLCRRRPEFLLTDEGQALLRRARAVLEGLADFEAAATHWRQAPGRISIGMSVPQIAMPLVAGFRVLNPEMSIKTQVSNSKDLLSNLQKCVIDVGLMTLLEPPVGFHCAQVRSQRLMVCLPANDPWAARDEIPIEELIQRPWVFREPGSQTRVLLETTLARRGLSVNIALEAGSREAMREAVVAGLGVGALFESEHGQDQRLALVPLAPDEHGAAIYAVVAAESLAVPSIKTFLDYVLTHASHIENLA